MGADPTRRRCAPARGTLLADAESGVDTLLAERGLAGSRTSAAESVRAGRVRIGRDGPLATKPSQLVAEDAELLLDRAAALRLARRAEARATRSTRSAIDVAGRDCLDVGASTGGFTDCLLQRGAARVIALDVAHGQLDWGLRNDPRVTVIERAQRARARARRAAVHVPTWRRSTSRSSRWPRCCPRSPACLAADGRDAGAGQAAVRARPRAGRQGRGGARAGDRRDALARGGGRGARAPGSPCAASPRRGCPGPKGNRETFIWLRRASGDGVDGRRGGDLERSSA